MTKILDELRDDHRNMARMSAATTAAIRIASN